MAKIQQKLLTIIIPVYKVEKYIRQCLDSVILPDDQMGFLEVIVVNDGTPDNSALIAHEYSDKYPDTIRVIDKENGGHGSAWNLGVGIATGKYIRFLDSDDWLSNLSDFIIRLETVDTDLIFTNLNKFFENTGKCGIQRIKGVDYDKVYYTSSFSYLDTGNDYYIWDFWYCTYRTEMLQKEFPLFMEKVSYDDAILFIAPFILGDTMLFLDIPLYNYRLGRNDQSVNHKVELKRYKDYAKVSKSLIDFSQRHLDINDNKARQRDVILSRYMKNRCALFSCLPYREYCEVMNEWFPYIEKTEYINLSPKMRLYKMLPSCISYSLFQVINKFIIK